MNQTSNPLATSADEPAPLHVVYCFDQNYEQHFGASVTSLLLNREAPADLHVHVVIAELTVGLEAGLRRLTDAFRAHFHVHVVRAQDLQRLPQIKTKRKPGQYLTTAAYYRILLPDILPPDIGRALYLDADTIVLSDLRVLHDVDLGHAIAGGVIDLQGVAMAAQKCRRAFKSTQLCALNFTQGA